MCPIQAAVAAYRYIDRETSNTTIRSAIDIMTVPIFGFPFVARMTAARPEHPWLLYWRSEQRSPADIREVDTVRWRTTVDQPAEVRILMTSCLGGTIDKSQALRPNPYEESACYVKNVVLVLMLAR
nr:hypothetical protein CFP56_08016 [Quercus suber]